MIPVSLEFSGLNSYRDAQSIDFSDLMAQFLSGAAPCEIDKQGRILLPAKLREYAGLSKDVAVVGVGSHIEIWDLKAWDAMNDFDADEMARNMEDLGI